MIRIPMIVTALLLAQAANAAGDGGAHPHHISVATGIARFDGKSSAFLGIDYTYRFNDPWAIGLFLEEVSGDFDLRAWGVSVGRYFDSGWKVGAGIGAEYKFKSDKTLGLIHVTAGYDWHIGNWSVGPVATVDFIEGGDQTYYLGAALGYGF